MGSFLAAVAIFVASIFGFLGQVLHHFPTAPPQAVAVATIADSQRSPSGALAVTSATFPPVSRSSAGASSGQAYSTPAPHTAGVVLGTSTQISYVTQDELNQTANALRSLIYQAAASNTPVSIPQYIAAGGNPDNPYAGLSRINNLQNVTITGATITNSSVNGGSGGSGSSQWTTSGSDISYAAGDVAIGTTTARHDDPWATLTIAGNGGSDLYLYGQQ